MKHGGSNLHSIYYISFVAVTHIITTVKFRVGKKPANMVWLRYNMDVGVHKLWTVL